MSMRKYVGSPSTVCSRVSQYVARNLRGRQGAWNVASQERISLTSVVLSAIKNIKMLGLEASASSYIERLRRAEIDAAGRVRWMMVAYNASANALGMFAPVLTLVLYAIFAGIGGTRLDAETAFTTMAILGMVTHPANMIMTIVPRVIASFSSFERIQSFLLEPPLNDQRVKTSATTHHTTDHTQQIAISFENVSVQISRPILQGITFEVPRGSVFICAGPTAAGKSTIARAILGEVQPTSGTILVDTKRMGYCAQSTWLPSGTVKDIIMSFSRTSEENPDWYQEVIRVCCLNADLADLPNGDATLVGSRGMNLSGGQRQRLVGHHLYNASSSHAANP